MTAEQFAYWLQGYSEVHGAPPTPAQWKQIQDHLALVFKKVTPANTLSQPAWWQQAPFQQWHGPAGDFPPGTIIC